MTALHDVAGSHREVACRTRSSKQAMMQSPETKGRRKGGCKSEERTSTMTCRAGPASSHMLKGRGLWMSGRCDLCCGDVVVVVVVVGRPLVSTL